MKSRKFFAQIAISVFLGLGAQIALAQGFLGYAKTEHEITVGLDSKTRKLIESLPKSIREQLVLALRELDVSVYGYLNAADQVLMNRINQITCSGQALAGGAIEQIKVELGVRATPVTDLQVMFDNRSATFKTSRAIYITTSYVDFLHAAGITACKGADAAVESHVNKLRTEARAKWFMWREMTDAGTCILPSECLQIRYDTVNALIKISNYRDLSAARASDQFKSVERSPRSFLPLLQPKMTVFEDELMKLYAIERSIESAKLLRLSAAEDLANATLKIKDARIAADNASGYVSGVFPKDWVAAKNAAQGAVKPHIEEEIIRLLDMAVSKDSELLTAAAEAREAFKAAVVSAREAQAKAVEKLSRRSLAFR